MPRAFVLFFEFCQAVFRKKETFSCTPNKGRKTNLSLIDFSIAVASNRIVFNMAELTGNIWMAALKEE